MTVETNQKRYDDDAQQLTVEELEREQDKTFDDRFSAAVLPFDRFAQQARIVRSRGKGELLLPTGQEMTAVLDMVTEQSRGMYPIFRALEYAMTAIDMKAGERFNKPYLDLIRGMNGYFEQEGVTFKTLFPSHLDNPMEIRAFCKDMNVRMQTIQGRTLHLHHNRKLDVHSVPFINNFLGQSYERFGKLTIQVIQKELLERASHGTTSLLAKREPVTAPPKIDALIPTGNARTFDSDNIADVKRMAMYVFHPLHFANNPDYQRDIDVLKQLYNIGASYNDIVRAAGTRTFILPGTIHALGHLLPKDHPEEPESFWYREADGISLEALYNQPSETSEQQDELAIATMRYISGIRRGNDLGRAVGNTFLFPQRLHPALSKQDEYTASAHEYASLLLPEHASVDGALMQQESTDPQGPSKYLRYLFSFQNQMVDRLVVDPYIAGLPIQPEYASAVTAFLQGADRVQRVAFGDMLYSATINRHITRTLLDGVPNDQTLKEDSFMSIASELGLDELESRDPSEQHRQLYQHLVGKYYLTLHAEELVQTWDTALSGAGASYQAFRREFLSHVESNGQFTRWIVERASVVSGAILEGLGELSEATTDTLEHVLTTYDYPVNSTADHTLTFQEGSFPAQSGIESITFGSRTSVTEPIPVTVRLVNAGVVETLLYADGSLENSSVDDLGTIPEIYTMFRFIVGESLAWVSENGGVRARGRNTIPIADPVDVIRQKRTPPVVEAPRPTLPDEVVVIEPRVPEAFARRHRSSSREFSSTIDEIRGATMSEAVGIGLLYAHPDKFVVRELCAEAGIDRSEGQEAGYYHYPVDWGIIDPHNRDNVEYVEVKAGRAVSSISDKVRIQKERMGDKPLSVVRWNQDRAVDLPDGVADVDARELLTTTIPDTANVLERAVTMIETMSRSHVDPAGKQLATFLYYGLHNIAVTATQLMNDRRREYISGALSDIGTAMEAGDSEALVKLIRSKYFRRFPRDSEVHFINPEDKKIYAGNIYARFMYEDN